MINLFNKTDDLIKMINLLSKTDDFIKMINLLCKTYIYFQQKSEIGHVRTCQDLFTK